MIGKSYNMLIGNYDALVDGKIETFNFQNCKGKYTVLLFYPLDFTFVCPTELIGFSDRIDEFKALNTNIVGISVDSVYSHLFWAQTDRKHGGIKGISFPLVSDINKEISKSMKVLKEEDGIAFRGMLIFDPDGVLRIYHVNDLPIGRSVDEVIRLVTALQFHSENGEVCPLNWKKGEDGIIPNTIESKKYFDNNFQ